MKQLERLLFVQGNRCFLCQRPIPPGEASVEHLVATSNGGMKDDENCIACCKSVNAALGNLSIKAKLQVVLNQRGAFVCPATSSGAATAQAVTDPASLLPERLALVIADLQRRGPSKPRRVATLLNTMNSVFQMQLPEPDLTALLAALREEGYIAVEDTKVSYALPAQGT